MTSASLVRIFERSLKNLKCGAQVERTEAVKTLTPDFLRLRASSYSGACGSNTVYISAHDHMGNILFHLDNESWVANESREDSFWARSKSVFCHLMEYDYIDRIHHFILYKETTVEYQPNQHGGMEWYDQDELVTMFVVENDNLQVLLEEEKDYVKEAIACIQVSS